MRLMRFNRLAEHVPGKQMVVAEDTLCRSPLKLKEEPDTVEDAQAFVDLVESKGHPRIMNLSKSWKQAQRMPSSKT